MGRFVAIVGSVLLLGACSSSGGADGRAGDPIPEAGSCGGSRGLVCEAGLWCDPEPGRCDAADAPGLCIVVPEACTRDYRPVCGCDGRTYGNDCTRRSARVARDHDGECASRSAGGSPG